MSVRHAQLTTAALTLAITMQAAGTVPLRLALTSLEKLAAQSVEVSVATHRGRKAVRLLETPATSAPDTHSMAVVDGSRFENGTIEVDLAGEPTPGASDTARGFVGVAFRVADDRSRFEVIYIRPSNARADDQLRRNHSTQYASHPDYPWNRLRKESPGVYESYVDLETGAWTHLRIEVRGSSARLYVNRASQPALVVNDLKNPASAGSIALWIGPEAVGHFSNLVVTPDK